METLPKNILSQEMETTAIVRSIKSPEKKGHRLYGERETTQSVLADYKASILNQPTRGTISAHKKANEKVRIYLQTNRLFPRP